MEPDKHRPGFFHNAAILTSANVFERVITIALTAVLTRIYSPMAFGIFSTVLAVSSIMAAVSNLRYSQAILLMKTERQADAITLLSLILVFLVSALLSCTLFFSKTVSEWLNLQNEMYLLTYIPILVFLGGVRVTLDSWYLREHKTRNMAVAQVQSAFVDRASSIALGFGLNGSTSGLAAGRLLSQLLYVIYLAGVDHGLFIKRIGRYGLRRLLGPVALRFRHMPLYSWSTLSQQGNQHLPIVILGIVFTPAIAGYYALARRILLEPVYLLGDSLGRVLFQKTAVDHREGRCLRETTKQLFERLLAIFIVPMAMFPFIAPQLFSVLFGEEWRVAGVYSAILTPMFLTVLLFRPFTPYFDLFGLQRKQAIFETSVLLISGATLIIGSVYLEPIALMYLFSAISTLVFLKRLTWLLHLGGLLTSDVIGILIPKIGIALICAMLAFALVRYGNMTELMTITSVCTLVILLEAVIVMRDARIMAFIRKAGR